MLSATDVLAYHDTAETLDALRAWIRAAGISIVAREARVSRSVVKAFVNQGTAPHGPTLAKIKAALERLGSAVLGES